VPNEISTVASYLLSSVGVIRPAKSHHWGIIWTIYITVEEQNKPRDKQQHR